MINEQDPGPLGEAGARHVASTHGPDGTCSRCGYTKADGHHANCIHYDYWKQHTHRSTGEPTDDRKPEGGEAGARLRALVARLSRLAANVTKANEFQCLRRDREAEDGGGIEYQIFADTEKPKNGLQVAYVQSTKHDAEFIAFALNHARELAELEALLSAPVVSPPLQKLVSRIAEDEARYAHDAPDVA